MKKRVYKRLDMIDESLEIIVDRLSSLDDRIEDLEVEYKPFSGAISIDMDRDEIQKFYMVTDMHFSQNFLEFHHLVDPDGRQLTADSFPVKDPKISILQHMRNVYKSGRWSIIKEQIIVGSFAGISSIGGFTYSKKMKKGDYPYKFNENKEAVIPIKKEG